MTKLSEEEQKQLMIDAIKSLLSYGHEFDAITYQVCSFGIPHRKEMVAECVHCHQMVFANINYFPKPILFGRSNWKQVELFGLPTHVYCGYLRRQAIAVHVERIKR